MSRLFQPNHHSPNRRYSPTPGTNALSLVRERGVYGMVVAVTAMALGLSPTLFLLWWNWFRLTPVPITAASAHVRVQVKSGQLTKDAEKEEPGETALLHVTCEVGRPGRWRDLLQFEDDARRQPDDFSPPLRAR